MSWCRRRSFVYPDIHFLRDPWHRKNLQFISLGFCPRKLSWFALQKNPCRLNHLFESSSGCKSCQHWFEHLGQEWPVFKGTCACKQSSSPDLLLPLGTPAELQWIPVRWWKSCSSHRTCRSMCLFIWGSGLSSSSKECCENDHTLLRVCHGCLLS